MEILLEKISSTMWSIFLPLLLIFSIFITFKFFKIIKNKISSPNEIIISQIIGPVAISLGAMVGTGAVIGVLGSLSSIYITGQNYIEAIVGWAIIGMVLLLPLAYIETMVAKVTKLNPKQYIATFFSKKAATVYAVSFCIMYILGFGGFQFSGINSTVTIIINNFTGGSMSEFQRYILIVIPLLIFVSMIVLTKKHDLFIKVMSLFIGVAVILYILFIGYFLIQTADYIPVFFDNLVQGMKNPVTTMIGVPIGMIVSFQRIIQTSEPGLGALAIASLESDSKPRPAALVSVCTSLITIFLAIFVTTYIVSYGLSNQLIDLSTNNSLFLLEGFFLTGYSVGGYAGLIILIIFTIFSGITTLLGSFYFLSKLFELNENLEIGLYILMLFIAGTLAIFGGSLIFEIVDLLLFIVVSINVIALFIFTKEKYKNYLKENTKGK